MPGRGSNGAGISAENSPSRVLRCSGGGSGIRTHGRLPFTRFPSVPVRPLSHSSWCEPKPTRRGLTRSVTVSVGNRLACRCFVREDKTPSRTSGSRRQSQHKYLRPMIRINGRTTSRGNLRRRTTNSGFTQFSPPTTTYASAGGCMMFKNYRTKSRQKSDALSPTPWRTTQRNLLH